VTYKTLLYLYTIVFIKDWCGTNILIGTHEYNKINYILNTHRLIDAHVDEIN